MKIKSTVLYTISVDTPEISFLVLWLFHQAIEVSFLVHTNKNKKRARDTLSSTHLL